jgi:hypothetical protein
MSYVGLCMSLCMNIRLGRGVCATCHVAWAVQLPLFSMMSISIHCGLAFGWMSQYAQHAAGDDV